jgi:hypothetical protein
MGTPGQPGADITLPTNWKFVMPAVRSFSCKNARQQEPSSFEEPSTRILTGPVMGGRVMPPSAGPESAVCAGDPPASALASGELDCPELDAVVPALVPLLLEVALVEPAPATTEPAVLSAPPALAPLVTVGASPLPRSPDAPDELVACPFAPDELELPAPGMLWVPGWAEHAASDAVSVITPNQCLHPARLFIG